MILFHLGMIVVGTPYSEPRLMNMEVITGGTPYGATTLASPDGRSRPVSDNESRDCALSRPPRRISRAALQIRSYLILSEGKDDDDRRSFRRLFMKVVILDGHAINPGDLSWDALRGLGELEVFDRTPEHAIVARVGEADVLLTLRTPLS
jgi:hypothetical protein